MKKYSIAVRAPYEINSIVKEMKRKVASKIGWFPSRNSEAHITFIEFIATDFELQVVSNILKRISERALNGSLAFNKVAGFVSSGSVFLEPTDDSANYLKDLLKAITLPAKIEKSKSYHPHMTIARKLRKEQMSMAMSLFRKPVDLHFECNGIVLREFDERKEQFSVIRKFPFGNNSMPAEGEQISLF